MDAPVDAFQIAIDLSNNDVMNHNDMITMFHYIDRAMHFFANDVSACDSSYTDALRHDRRGEHAFRRQIFREEPSRFCMIDTKKRMEIRTTYRIPILNVARH